jgi:membrane-associated protease RseP (regulator of RpoE activity)
MRNTFICGLVAAGLVLALAAANRAAEPQRKPVQPSRLSTYWLGVECYPAPEALQTHLHLPAGQGLLVAHVLPDGPAAKAGLREHDVLLKAAGKPLGEVRELIAAVDAAQHNTLKLEVLREGRTLSVDIQPAKRPEMLPADEDLNLLRGWFNRMLPGENWPPRFYVFRPGTILPAGVSTLPALDEDTTVVITRRGSQPAKIVVEKGSQRWEVSEKELDKLPADVRPQIEWMIHPYDWKSAVSGIPCPMPPKPTGAAEAQGHGEKQLQQHMERMQRQLEELRKSMDELRTKPAQPK